MPRTSSPRAITLIELLVAMVVSSLVLASAGAMLMRTLLGYRNAQFLAEGVAGQSSADSTLQSLLMGISLNPASKKVFDATTTVNSADGSIVSPTALAYDRLVDDDVPGASPPTCDDSRRRTRTGLVFWYRAGPTGAPPFGDSTRYIESTLYWYEVDSTDDKSGMTAPFSFCSKDAAGVLAFQNDARYRRRSVALATSLAAFKLASSTAASELYPMEYRLEFLLPTF